MVSLNLPRRILRAPAVAEVADRFRLSNNQVRTIFIFLAQFYVPAWLSATAAADAPVNDLLLIQRLLKYRTVDGEVAEATLAVIRRHMWYLRPADCRFRPLQ